MKKVVAIIIFTAVIVALVALVVFTNGNDQQPSILQNNQSQTTATTNLTILPAINSSVITLAQLSEHGTKADCWVGYNKSAYDITSWLPRHPGSSTAIEPYCGTAAEFEAAFKGQHGTSQVKKLIAEGEYKGALG